MEKFEDTMSNFEYVRTKKAQNDAIEKLNGYLENASAGVKKEIEEAIAEINKAESTETVKTELEKILNIVDPVLVAQEEAEDILKIYEESIASEKVGLTKAQQAVINNEISKIRETINNAKTADEIKDAVQNFEDLYLKEGIYSAVKVDAEAKILQAAKESAYKKLAEYENYDDEEIKQEVANYKKAIDEKDTVEDINNIMDDVKDAEGKITKKGALTTLKEKVEKIEADKENQQKLYKQAYDNVMEELNEVEIYMAEAQKQGKLSDDEVAEIKKMIQTTQTKLVNVSTAKEVYNARDAFEDYMINYYEEIAEFEFSYKKDKAIEKLNEYINSNASKEIKDIARSAKSQIEAITEYSKEVTDKIEGILNTAESDIANRKTAEAKAVAIAEITKNKAEVDVLGDEKLTADIEEALANIKNAETEKDVNKIYNNIMKEINNALGKKSPEEQLADYKQEAIEEMKEIKDLATDLNETALLNELKLTETAINEATTTQEVDELVEKMNAYVGRYYNELLEKKKNIDELNKILNVTYPNDKKIQSIIEKAIRDVKAASTPERRKDIMTEVRGENPFTDADTVGGTVGARIKEVQTFEEAKKTAIQKLDKDSDEDNAKYVEYDETVKIMVQNTIDEINSIQFEDYNEDEKSFDGYVSEILSTIGEYVNKAKAKAIQEITEYDYDDTGIVFIESLETPGIKSGRSNAIQLIKESVITMPMEVEVPPTTIAEATTANDVNKIVSNTKLKIDITTARWYIESIKKSNTYANLPQQNRTDLETLLKQCKNNMDSAKNHAEVIALLEQQKDTISNEVKSSQKEVKDAGNKAIHTESVIGSENTGVGDKNYNDFQENITCDVEKGSITATLNKLNDWTAFGAPEEQSSGYYIALEVKNDLATKIKVKKSHRNASSANWVTEEKTINSNSETIIFYIPKECFDESCQKFKENTFKIEIEYINDNGKVIDGTTFDDFDFTLTPADE